MQVKRTLAIRLMESLACVSHELSRQTNSSSARCVILPFCNLRLSDLSFIFQHLRGEWISHSNYLTISVIPYTPIVGDEHSFAAADLIDASRLRAPCKTQFIFSPQSPLLAVVHHKQTAYLSRSCDLMAIAFDASDNSRSRTHMAFFLLMTNFGLESTNERGKPRPGTTAAKWSCKHKNAHKKGPPCPFSGGVAQTMQHKLSQAQCLHQIVSLFCEVRIEIPINIHSRPLASYWTIQIMILSLKEKVRLEALIRIVDHIYSINSRLSTSPVLEELKSLAPTE